MELDSGEEGKCDRIAGDVSLVVGIWVMAFMYKPASQTLYTLHYIVIMC